MGHTNSEEDLLSSSLSGASKAEISPSDAHCIVSIVGVVFQRKAPGPTYDIVIKTNRVISCLCAGHLEILCIHTNMPIAALL